jgi:hypothetical protein
MKKLIALVLGFFMASAFASFPPVSGYQYKVQSTVNYGQAWASTTAAALVSYCAVRGIPSNCYYANSFDAATQIYDPYVWGNNSASVYFFNASNVRNSAGFANVGRQTGNICPANSSLVGSSCTCDAGFDESGSTCVPNMCAAKKGVPYVVDFTVGYARTDGLGSNADDYDCVGGCNKFPASKQWCSDGCRVDISDPVAAWRSVYPTANGLYRMSIDINVVPTGDSCTSSSAESAIDKTTPAPPCPGFVGEINGKTGCFGTAQKPITTEQAPRSNAPVTGVGNPPAGTKPTSGEGSGSTGAGRTPAAGDGGNAGGPAAAANGPKGTTPKPAEGEEQQNCGAPGQPTCKIDETGTKSDSGTTFGDAKTGLGQAAESRKNAIDGAQNIATPSWSFTFQLPTGCSPLHTAISGFVLNPCAYQSVIHDLMSMIWAAVTAFSIIGMVGRTIRES